jgi:hypothetical protein
MSLLLVDDRDGRVVAQLETHEQALNLLERLATNDPDMADSLGIVAFRDRQGAVVTTESSVTIRPLRP